MTRRKHPFIVQRTVPAVRFSWDKPISIQFVLHGSIVEIFVNKKIVLLIRVYYQGDGYVRLFVEYGEAHFDGTRLKSLP